jgi:hypothetical protein
MSDFVSIYYNKKRVAESFRLKLNLLIFAKKMFYFFLITRYLFRFWRRCYNQNYAEGD